MQAPQAEDSYLTLSVAWEHGQTEGRRYVRSQATTDAVGRKDQREDPFRPEDSNELHAQCKRMPRRPSTSWLAGWREHSGYRLFYFMTWAKTRALQHWIDRSGIAHRPMPKLGPSAAEIEQEKA